MKGDIIFGIVIIIGGLGLLTYLILWSRRTIERIAQKGSGSLREIMKELGHGR